MYVCVSEGKKCWFFGNFGVLCFLETPVLTFALLPYYRRILINNGIHIEIHIHTISCIHVLFCLFVCLFVCFFHYLCVRHVKYHVIKNHFLSQVTLSQRNDFKQVNVQEDICKIKYYLFRCMSTRHPLGKYSIIIDSPTIIMCRWNSAFNNNLQTRH